MTPIRAQLYVGNRRVTRVADLTWLRTVDSPVDRILVRETVEDPESAYPHFLVEAFDDDDGCAPTQPPQDKWEYDVFRIHPVEVELGESRCVIVSDNCRTSTLTRATKPTPGSARVFLTTNGGRNNVTDAPLAELETVAHGRIRIVKVVHDDNPYPSFFVEACGGDPAAIALLSALLSTPPAPGRDLPVIDLQ